MDRLVLGIDCGGTHTDAALLAVDAAKGSARLLASAKTGTNHENLPASILEAARLLDMTAEQLRKVERVTLGTTLEVNALVQNKADKVALALSSGPGLDPIHFGLGDTVCIVPGGLDHRGVEVSKLYTGELEKQAALWKSQGIGAVACVGKFSPRNPAHENAMGDVVKKVSDLPVTLGHNLSGKLNFPRRIATAYYNAAVQRIHHSFLDAVEKTFADLGIRCQFRLLKADGGAMPFAFSRQEPVQSILSGPAASVMGALAMWANASHGCSLLLDMGGTTTDIALFNNGSPVVDRQGMVLDGRRTLVRSLASISIGVGGDSLLGIKKDADGNATVCTESLREGPCMAFGGASPTLMDALNTLDGANSPLERGDIQKSIMGLEDFCRRHSLKRPEEAAKMAVADALDKMCRAAYDLVENVNSRPIYTLAGLKAVREARPKIACFVGGPAACMKDRLAASLGMPVELSPYPQVANAIGAALTLPTATLDIYADTGKGELYVPAMNYVERIPKNYTLEQAESRACDLLRQKLAAENIEDAQVEVIEGDLFATLDDYGRGSRDIRVAVQGRPGIAGRLEGQEFPRR